MYIYICIYIYIPIYIPREIGRDMREERLTGSGYREGGRVTTSACLLRSLALTRYCYAQYYMVYGISTGGRRGRILRNGIATVLQPCAAMQVRGGNIRMIDSCTKA